MTIKQQRTAERIRQILSELLLREVSDPRLQGVTVTEVKLDPEMRYARVYVNALGDEERQAEVLAGLARAKGFLRRSLGQLVRMRTVPELQFQWDAALEYGERINQLIASLDIPPAPPEDDLEDDFDDEWDDWDDDDDE